jgi:hypothetical protein
MSAQLAFAALLREADDHQQAALDRHRERVQTWFDELEPADKGQLAEWFETFEWDTCVALAAAAGDYRSRV